MTRIIAVPAALVLAAISFAQPAAAQNPSVGGAIIGGGIGAAIGGAATGRAGGAIAGGIIGAAAGAALGAQLEARPRGYYWYGDHCYYRRADGNYYLVKRSRCF
ncbi:MAG TPA: hypothetical protein VG986_02675 [Pseudolabrys sp.]|nr:hypothetical protein [Pseudolabrys sp.]